MQSPAQLLPPVEMGTTHMERSMHYFVTTVDIYCDDFEPEYTRKFFRSKEAMEAYLVTLEDDEIHSYGPWPKVLDEIPF